MAEAYGVYKCGICGNMVGVLHAGNGEMICCGQFMDLLSENTVDASLEKHVPALRQEGNLLHISVGSVEHPMIVEHYIEWIEVKIGSRVLRQDLRPGQEPKATFSVFDNGDPIEVRAYCNLHGLWKA